MDRDPQTAATTQQEVTGHRWRDRLNGPDRFGEIKFSPSTANQFAR
jgi:hypothetical protein